jgi:hypothetical protein
MKLCHVIKAAMLLSYAKIGCKSGNDTKWIPGLQLPEIKPSSIILIGDRHFVNERLFKKREQ